MKTVSLPLAIGGAALALAVGAGVATTIALTTRPDSDRQASSSASTSTLPVKISVVPPTRTTTEVPPSGVVGQPVTNGGIKLTINSVSQPADIPRTDGDVPPRSGAKIVRVDTTIENVGQKSIDLTCSYPVANKIYDSSKREFDTVDDLYKIPGNPECNADLQPGFSSPMSYVYEVPVDANIEFFGFADSEVNYGADLKFVTIG